MSESRIDEPTMQFLNIAIDHAHIKKIRGWKSFEGMVKVLASQNKKLSKLGVRAQFTVTLPLPMKSKARSLKGSKES